MFALPVGLHNRARVKFDAAPVAFDLVADGVIVEHVFDA